MPRVWIVLLGAVCGGTASQRGCLQAYFCVLRVIPSIGVTGLSGGGGVGG